MSHLSLLFGILMIIVKGVESIDTTVEIRCQDMVLENSISCNKRIDPWIGDRDTLDMIMAGSPQACPDSTTAIARRDDRELCDQPVVEEDDLWSYSENGNDVVNNTLPDRATVDEYWSTSSYDDSDDEDQTEDTGLKEEMSDADRKEKMGEISDATSALDVLKEAIKYTEKHSKGYLKSGLNLLKKFSSSFMFVGPVMDLIILFMPAGKSEELKAIESGFAKLNGRLDAVAVKLDAIEGSISWSYILRDIVRFESKVEHLMIKYENVGRLLKSMDLEDPTLSPDVKNAIEDLLMGITDGDDLGTHLNHVVRLYNGKSELNEGRSLLEQYLESEQNDCSKILGFSSQMMKLVRNAQKLVYFYEVNQGLVQLDDDRGYPTDLNIMYEKTTQLYIKCTSNAVTSATKEMEIRYGDGESLGAILPDLESRYIIYNWAVLKENDKQENPALVRNYIAASSDVELRSKDEKLDENLTLFAVTKSRKEEIDQVKSTISSCLDIYNAAAQNYWRRDIPMIATEVTWDSTVTRLLLNMLKDRSESLKEMIEEERLTLVVIKESSDASLEGWHMTKTVYIRFTQGFHGSDVIPVQVGFLFSFDDTYDFKCVYGNTLYLSVDNTLPYCSCSLGYSGDECDIPIKPVTSESNAVIELVQKYKVPGMFELQDEIRKSTEQIMIPLQEMKYGIFNEVRDTRFTINESKNNILCAQSLMLNNIKEENDRLLVEFGGIQKVLHDQFERERNERLYRSKEGNKVVVNTINSAFNEVENRLVTLTGRIIENRYFDSLKFTVPVFTERFEVANEFGDYALNDFADYIRQHEFKFNEAKQAVENAILADSDSFITARMQINMVDGCTDSYTEQIRSAWQELFQLHLSLTTIETAVAVYRINHSSNSDERDFLEYELESLNSDIIAVTDEFKRVYQERSCPEFSSPGLVGGGCKASTTYPGQVIPVRCSDTTKTLVDISTGHHVTEINCNLDRTWSVTISDLVCVPKCTHDDEIFDIGESRLLGEASEGFKWDDGLGETTCSIKQVLDSSSRPATNDLSYWSVISQVDINECLEEGFCGNGASFCTNTLGGFECSCLSGYHVASDNGKCEDFNECTVDAIGYRRCMVEQRLGTCRNSRGSYTCSCLVGSYPDPQFHQQGCKACECNNNGVTSEVCNNNGECQCREHVVGETCDTCQEGYTNFPSCNECSAGYFSFPNCRQCDCDARGVALQVCNARSGQCECSNEGIGGSRCNQCKQDYINYPLCEKVVRDGTLSPWSGWTGWTDLGSCGGYSVTSFQQRRTRYRRCDDGTKNIHGRSCASDLLQETETRTRDVCRRVNQVYIKLTSSSTSDTSGKIWASVKQGNTQCTTRKPTWDAPGTKDQEIKRTAASYGCTISIDVTKPIQMWIHSDSGNDLKLYYFGIYLGVNSEYDRWYFSRDLHIDKGKNNGWWGLDRWINP